MPTHSAPREPRLRPLFGQVFVVTIAAIIVGLHWLGVDQNVVDWKLTPQPKSLSQVVDLLVSINQGLREAAPPLALAALAIILWFNVAGWSGGRQAVLNRMARAEFSGIDQLHKTSNTPSSRGRLPRWLSMRSFFAGTSVAVLAIILIGSTSGVESEVSNGPLRPIDSMLDVVAGPNPQPLLILQGPKITFMDDSLIDKPTMDRLVQDAPSQGLDMVPFGKHLFNINGKSGLEVSLPDEVFQRLGSSFRPRSCSEASAIVDDTVGASRDQWVSLNGVKVRVAAVRNDMAQMNRSIAILSDSDTRKCIQGGLSQSYFGAIVRTGTMSETEQAIDKAGLNGKVAVVSLADFKENNRNFWRANATPILLQLIAYIGLFCGFAAAGERRSILQRNIREIGMLNAAGVSFRTIRAIERRRAFRETFKALLIALPVMPLVAWAFNAAELGMKVGVGPREASVGFVITLAAKLFAGRRALTSFEKRLDLPQAVKG